VSIERTGLPGPGTIHDQDVRDLEAMDLMRVVWQQAAQEAVSERRAKQQYAAWTDERAEKIRRGEL
jgi:hypothetical protein